MVKMRDVWRLKKSDVYRKFICPCEIIPLLIPMLHPHPVDDMLPLVLPGVRYYRRRQRSRGSYKRI